MFSVVYHNTTIIFEYYQVLQKVLALSWERTDQTKYISFVLQKKNTEYRSGPGVIGVGVMVAYRSPVPDDIWV